MPKTAKGWDRMEKGLRRRSLVGELVLGAIVISMWYYIIIKFLDAI